MYFSISVIFIITYIQTTKACTIELGETLQWNNRQETCNTLTVHGNLEIGDNTHITADRIHIMTTGSFIVGSQSRPAKNVRIELQHSDCGSTGSESCLSRGQFYSEGRVRIYGEPKTPWTLLQEDCDACGTIRVAECDNWQVGDELVIAPTGGHATDYQSVTRSFDNFIAEHRTIASIAAGCVIGLDSLLVHLHRGSVMFEHVPVFAEVMNMDRSVKFTGPFYWKNSNNRIEGGQGIVTRQAYTGTMQIFNTRVERCGRVELGAYCLHFHRVGSCPECKFEGNVVTEGINKGITVHGTHYTSVSDNVVYDLRGAFIYVEDGNEYGNDIDRNCLVCPEISNSAPVGGLSYPNHRCGLEGIPEHRDSDFNEQSGIYLLSPYNNFRGNHIAGMENAWFTNHQGLYKYGAGAIKGLTCIVSLPFGEIDGNVFHNNAGFGWYTNVAYPTNVQLDTNGLVHDWETCLPFDMQTGADQAQNVVVKNHVEYFNDFSMGTYDMGDVTFENTVSAMNNKGMYFKTYRRGANSGPLCRNCKFINNGAAMEGPGGTGLVEFQNTDIINPDGGTNTVKLNHHCGFENEMTGSLCASHYKFDTPIANVNFVSEYALSNLVVLHGGETWFLTAGQQAFATACPARGAWTVCPGTDDIRILRIYSPDRGALRVTNHDENRVYQISHMGIRKFQGSTRYVYTGSCSGTTPRDCANYIYPAGYSFLVSAGATLTIDVPSYSGGKADLFVMEYSESQLPATAISVRVAGDSRLAGGACAVRSTHSRRFITPYGAVVPQAGAWWDCQRFATRSGAAEFLAQLKDPFAGPAQCGSGRVVDPQCVYAGKVGCVGDSGCRYCDSEPFNFCINRDVAFAPGATAVDARPFLARAEPLTLQPSTPHPTANSPTPTPVPTPVPTAAAGPACGSEPSSCSGHIDWAYQTGRAANPLGYDDFQELTGASLASSSREDMVVYFYCLPVWKSECNDQGLSLPCGRTCGGDAAQPIQTSPPTHRPTSPPTIRPTSQPTHRPTAPPTREPTRALTSPPTSLRRPVAPGLGFALSTGLMRSPLPAAQVARLALQSNVRKFRLYGWDNDIELMAAIISSVPSATFIIEIPPAKVNDCALDAEQCRSLLDPYDPFRKSISHVAIGNEPLHAGSAADLSLTPQAFERVADIVAAKGWGAKPIVPFSMHAFQNTYPPENAEFVPQFAREVTSILSNIRTVGSKFALHPYPYFVANSNMDLLEQSLNTVILKNQILACKAAMAKLGFSDIGVMITETGWPTAGTSAATTQNAEAFYNNLVASDIVENYDVYAFELIDEAQKPGTDEKHFGWFTEAGAAKFGIEGLSAAPACGQPAPAACAGHLAWALAVGRRLHPEFYPRFRATVGADLDAAAPADMALYFVCARAHPRDCAGLTPPCLRTCGNSDGTPFISEASTRSATGINGTVIRTSGCLEMTLVSLIVLLLMNIF